MTRWGWAMAATALALAAGLAPGAARGQIAAPELAPGSADVVVASPGFSVDPTFSLLNPAAMSFAKSSIFGLGQTRVDRHVQNPKQTEAYSGTFGGFRFTGDKLAIGLETIDFGSDKSNVNFTQKETNGAISGKVADAVAIGAGLDNIKASSGSTSDTVQHIMLGGAFRVGEVFFAGLGLGRDVLNHKSPGANYNDDRSITEYGLGIYTQRGVRWHMEYNVQEKDDYTDNTGARVGGYTRTAGVIELNWNSILLGVSGYQATAKTGNGSMSGTWYQAGWAPEKSFTASLRIQDNTEKTGSTKVSDSTTTTINLGYQF